MRLVCILQLCIAFTFLCWHLGYPFLGSVYEYKKEAALYEFIMQGSNRERFESLPPAVKDELSSKFSNLKKVQDRSSSTKFSSGLHRFIYTVSPLELAWLLMAIVLPVMALKRRPGIEYAIWLLPAAAFLYGVENSVWALPAKLPADAALFPTESYLNSNYVGTLQDSWDQYLAAEWGSGDKEEGLFRFNLQRALLRSVSPMDSSQAQEGFWMLCLYFAWNCLVAYRVWRVCRFDASSCMNISPA